MNNLKEEFLMYNNVTSDDAVELRFEDETIVVYRDVTYDLFHYKIYSHRTLDGRNVLQFYQQHCSEITPFCWLKLFHKHEVEIVPCKIRNGKVFYD